MVSTLLLRRIDTYVQDLFSDSKERLWNSANRIACKFKLEIVDISGTTRIVLKKKGSRTVIKIGYPSHNFAEYAAYKALECSVLGDLLAPCLGVSKHGYALEMQFISRSLPQARGDYYWFNPGFVQVRDKLERHFSFIKKYNKYAWGADFHEENMRVMRNGDIKIIDYSNLLADMFSRNSHITVKNAVQSILKLEFPRVHVSLKMNNRIISYKDNDVFYDVPVDYRRSEAII